MLPAGLPGIRMFRTLFRGPLVHILSLGSKLFALLAELLRGYVNGATMAPGRAGVRMLGWLARAR